MGLLRGEEERVEYMQGLSLYCAVYYAYSWGAAYSVARKMKPTSNTHSVQTELLTGMLLSSCTSALGRPFLFPSAGSSQTGPGKMRAKTISEFTLLSQSSASTSYS